MYIIIILGADRVAACIAVVYYFVLGCLNGGGQIKPSSGEDPKERLAKVELSYNSTR